MASVGVLVLVVGAVVATWGGQAHLDAPSIVPMRGIRLPGGATIRFDTLVELGAVAAIAVALVLVARTRIGLMARAVIERRQLAELTAIDVDRVSAVAWIVGTMLAGLSGILLAPALRLDPYGLTLVVLETMAVVVIARLSSPARRSPPRSRSVSRRASSRAFTRADGSALSSRRSPAICSSSRSSSPSFCSRASTTPKTTPLLALAGWRCGVTFRPRAVGGCLRLCSS